MTPETDMTNQPAGRLVLSRLDQTPAVLPPAVPRKGPIARLTESIGHKVHKNGLESNLEFYLNAARSHESNGLVQGHQLYKTLQSKALADAKHYSERRKVPMEDVYAGYPALIILQHLATPQLETEASSGPHYVKLGVAAAFILPIVWGFMTGMAQNVTHWITRLGGAQ